MYASLEDLRKLEQQTLRCISEMAEFGRLGSLKTGAQDAVDRMVPNRGPIDVHLSFSLEIRLRGDLSPRRFDLGALVRQAPDLRSVSGASYSVMIGRTDNPKRSAVLRKFHIDYEPISQRNPAEPKPSVHLQMCGKLSPKHVEAGYTETRLHALYPHFEKPRIPNQPTSIALLLNWLFLEFQSDLGAQAVLKAPRWRKLVAEAERTVLLPYYTGALKFLTSAGERGRSFLQYHLYEMQEAAQ